MVVVILLGWLALDTIGDYRHTLTAQTRAYRRIAYFIVATALALFVAVLFRLWCDVVPILIILVLLLCWLLVHRITAVE